MTGSRPLFVIFSAPQAVLATSATGFFAFFDYRTTGAVRPCQRLSTTTPAVTLTRGRKEDFSLALAHRKVLPPLADQSHRRLRGVRDGWGHLHLRCHELNLALKVIG